MSNRAPHKRGDSDEQRERAHLHSASLKLRQICRQRVWPAEGICPPFG